MRVTIFSIPLGAKPLVLCRNLCTLSVTYPLCGSSHTDTMENPSQKSRPSLLTDKFLSREDACFVQSIIHKLTIYSPECLSQNVMTQDQTCNPQMIGQALLPCSQSDCMLRLGPGSQLYSQLGLHKSWAALLSLSLSLFLCLSLPCIDNPIGSIISTRSVQETTALVSQQLFFPFLPAKKDLAKRAESGRFFYSSIGIKLKDNKSVSKLSLTVS